MDVITLAAQPREVGKKAARAARRAGDVPCVLYGHHVEPAVFQVSEKSLLPLIYTDEMHLVKVKINGDAWDCIVKDVAFHPVTDRPMHADFQVLRAGEEITLSVPVRYVGTPAGQTKGGRVTVEIHDLEISCLPKDIPSYIDVDVTHVEIGQAVFVRDLETEGLEIHAPGDQILMTVAKPRTLIEEIAEEELEPEAEEGEVEEGEEE